MATCMIPECERRRDARGYCSTHYQRWRKHGDPLANARQRPVCGLDGCDRPHQAKGYCSVHYYRQKRTGDVGPAEIKTPQPRNGRFVLHGYVFVNAPEHPRAARGYVREHILVMEKKLGRSLYPGEEVHHVNGVKDDNAPGNLELWVVRQPKGQRPEDLVEWAHEILRRYGGPDGVVGAAV